jgi:hypothetical protein
MDFELLSPISDVAIIASGREIRDLRRLQKAYGRGRWRDSRALRLFESKSCIGMKRTASENANSRSNTARGKRERGGGYVMCINNYGYVASLEIGKVYHAPAGNAGVPGWIRVVDESGEDYLYPAARFVPMVVPPKGRRALAAAANS